MTFVAKKLESDQIVVPMSAEDGQEYRCVSCDGLLFPRPHRSTQSSIARHFCHYDDTGCAGESDVHEHAKMMAVSLLMEIFEDEKNVHEIDWELDFDVANNKKQFADAGVKFDSNVKPWGQAIAVEVQHKNTSKKRGKTSKRYADEGVSVLWLRPHHLLKLGDDAKQTFESMLKGNHSSLKRNRKATGVRDAYPYIVFQNEEVVRDAQNAKKNQKKSIYSKSNRRRYYKKPRSHRSFYKVKYESLTPETQEWHCDKNGCTEHFSKIYDYERAGVKIKIQRCAAHGAPSESEIKTKFGLVRYGL